MENETQLQEEVQVEQKSSLHTVTPFSKYLAMGLFVLLPFVGGYVGYMFAPEKVVEVERVVVKEVDVEKVVQTEVTETRTVAQEDAVRNARYFSAYYNSNGGDLSYFQSKQLGIKFSYPKVWGEIASTSNTLSLQGFQRPWSDDGINVPFMSVSFQQGPPSLPRGVGWLDFAGLYDENYIADCESNSDCEIITNNHNLLIVKTLKPIDCFAGCADERLHFGYEYGIYNKNTPNQSVLMSPYALQYELWSPEQVGSLFENTVVKSFQFLD